MTADTASAQLPATALIEDVPASRVGPLAAARQAATLAWRSLVQIRHNPMELVDLSVQPIMFVLLFTYVFGGAIAGSTHGYLQFALAGIIVQNALFATLNTAMALNVDLTKGIYDRFRSLPIARSAPMAGRIVADIARQGWSMGMLLAVGTLLGFRLGTSPLAVVAAAGLLVVCCFGFSWIGMLVGVLVGEPEKVQIFAFTLVLPLTFTSNAFVATSTMPSWLQSWVEVNPITQLADAMRGLLVGGPVASGALASVLWAAVVSAVFAPLALGALRRRY
jgi:ABC-2 type transport system permease protein/oleandomycin transport system permease protein